MGSLQSSQDWVPPLGQSGGSLITLLLLQWSVGFPTDSEPSTPNCIHNFLVKFGPMGPSGNAYTCTAPQRSAIMSAGCLCLLLWGCLLWLPAHLSTQNMLSTKTKAAIQTSSISICGPIIQNWHICCTLICGVVLGVFISVCLFINLLLYYFMWS